MEEGKEKPARGFARSLTIASADLKHEYRELPCAEPLPLRRLAQLQLSEPHPLQPS